MMRLGFETIVWGRRIDDLDHMLKVIKACGYEGIELGQNHRDVYIMEHGARRPVKSIEQLLERLDEHGLKLIGLVGGTLRERMDFCQGFQEAYLYSDSWDDAHAQNLDDPSPYTIALHPHWFMRMRQTRHAEVHLEKYEDSPYLQLIVDTAHAEIAEDDPRKAITRYMYRLASVHVKDWRPDFGRWSHRYARGFCPPGEGIVPIGEVMQRLSDLNYDGWVVLEQDHYESTRELTALGCAQWAAKYWSGTHFPPFEPDAGEVRELATAHRERRFKPTDRQTEQEVQIARDLSFAGALGPDVFYPAVTRLLRKSFEVAEAVKLWSYNPFTDELCLLAADVHEDLPECEKLLVARKGSLFEEIIQSPRIMVHEIKDEAVRGRIDDRRFIDALQADWMVSVPVFNSANAHHLRYVLNIFLEEDPITGPPLGIVGNTISEDNRRAIEHYAGLLSVWADYLTDQTCSMAAGATSHICGEWRSDVIRFVDALLEHLQKLFKCENATLFLVDESKSRLEPAGDTVNRITWRAGLRPDERFYSEGEGITGGTWKSREMFFSSDAAKLERNPKSFEKTVEEERRELLTAPLARRGGEVLGVVRLHNKRPREQGSASTMFTDDDAAKLDAVIQTALPHLDLLIRQRRQSYALARLKHELQTPLNGIVGALQFLRNALDVRGHYDFGQELGGDHIGAALSYRALMSRLVNNADLFGGYEQLRPRDEVVDIFQEVIKPICDQLVFSLQQERLPANGIEVSAGQDVLPRLHVDRSMLQQVFFNLLMNAIKYRDKNGAFRVQISAAFDEEDPEPAYVISVADWGIGLDEENESGESLFLPGVRGVNALKNHHVSGMGIGLAVVRRILEAHGGTISFASPRKPTTVQLRFPAELKDFAFSIE